MTKALIFDLDGVLTDTVELHYRSWRRLAEELSLPFDREDNERLRGRSRKDALELFLAGRADGIDRRWLLSRKNEFFMEAAQGMNPSHLAPGARSLLEEARSREILLALASSSRNARFVCARLGISEMFDAFADGCMALRPKPSPDIFLWAAGRLGLEPRACTVVEDAEAGVRAALDGGFRVVGLGPEERVGEAHLVLPDLSSVLLEELLGTGPGRHSGGGSGGAAA